MLITLRPLVRAAAIACAVAALAACADDSTSSSGGAPAAAATPAAVPWAGALLVNPLPKPEFTLTTEAGQPFDFQKQTQGKVTLLYFGYTNCPDACPTAMASIALALRQLTPDERAKVETVFVSTDPARDTPQRLKTWLGQFDPSFIGLTGTPAQLAAAQTGTALDVATQDPIPGAAPGAYGVDHAAVIVVFTPDNLAHVEWPDGVATSDIARDLGRLTTTGFTGVVPGQAPAGG